MADTQEGLLVEYQATKRSIAIMEADLVQAEVAVQATPAWKAMEDAKKLLAQAKNELAEQEQKIKDDMLSHNVKVIESFDTRLSLKKSPGAVVVTNEEVVPAEYKKEKVTVTLDKKKISDDIKAGKDVYGCELQYSWSLIVTKKDDDLPS